MAEYAVLDAARDYSAVAMARIVSPHYQSLFEGDRGERLDDVAAHLFQADDRGNVARITLCGAAPGEFGVFLESRADFVTIRKHLRRRLSVIRERDGKRVFFRFYDPRVMRSFLPACAVDEAAAFLGPIDIVRVQDEEPGFVLTFERRGPGLALRRERLCDVLEQMLTSATPAVA